ncbi:hypothetical protein ACH5RR_001076 [Cinchona calisaya]|uniref:Uncharacterized protein n=1 Tax=Cinchona calisaya TaxID=153742 RepID=A0ABD3B2Y4_9GENT
MMGTLDILKSILLPGDEAINGASNFSNKLMLERFFSTASDSPSNSSCYFLSWFGNNSSIIVLLLLSHELPRPKASTSSTLMAPLLAALVLLVEEESSMIVRATFALVFPPMSDRLPH